MRLARTLETIALLNHLLITRNSYNRFEILNHFYLFRGRFGRNYFVDIFKRNVKFLTKVTTLLSTKLLSSDNIL